MAEPREIDLDELRPRLERAFDFAGRQVRATIERTPDYFPIYTAGGRWKHSGELWTDWCAGFHAGMMWLLAERKASRDSINRGIESALAAAAKEMYPEAGEIVIKVDPDSSQIEATRDGTRIDPAELGRIAAQTAKQEVIRNVRDEQAWWRAQAEHYSGLIEHKKHDRDVHDLGFIFLNTYLPWYRLTGDERLHQVLITAGRTLAMRFNAKGRYLRSFVAPESLFIDIMMNVPIIFYAARETADRELHELAVAHCRTTERTLVRADGGTAHEGIFDLETGEFLRQTTHQGLRGDSDWTRGLAWSLYGYGTVFTYTRDPADLAVAERNADHYIARAPEGLVPPWDFDVPPGPDRIDDSSAGAIAASGLWNLAHLTGDPARARRYRNAALTILDTLCTDRYLAWNTPGWEGVLMHGVYHFHKKLGVDESVMWGEFFFLEAVAKVLGVRKRE